MECLYCDQPETCYYCPLITNVYAPNVVNIGDEYQIILKIQSYALYVGDNIRVCLYEGGQLRDSTGTFNLPAGQQVEVTFYRTATLAVTLFYNATVSVEGTFIDSCSDNYKFQVRCTFPEQRYDCVNNACQAKDGGQYTEPTCNNTCKPPERRYNCVDNQCKLQEGGPVAPAQDPAAQLQAMAQQVIESVGPEMALALAQMIVEMVQGASQQAPQGAPVMARKGGKLVFTGRK